MKLPGRLNELLAQDNGLYAFTLKAITVIEPWARDNKTVFFQDYTDHSLLHLAEVLSAADSLISDQSWPHLTPEDAAVITMSVLLHDCALHLSEEGFYSMIDGTYQAAQSRYAEADEPWPVLWEQFLAEARRFDQRRLRAIFGDTEPVSSYPRNKLDMTLKHRLLAGEFLRRHHARLAHEIALAGIPGPGNPLPIADSVYRDLLDLCGYVARSHNLSIRDAVDRLEPSKRRIHLNCRVPFAMVVLRIADYIQIHSSRAPGQLLRLKSLSSPISRGEWRKHAAVREINQAHDDPEAIFVDCEPETAATFVGMQRLLGDIQKELDQCWAVMGEVYGRFSPLTDLGITIRRVRSNIDDPTLFQLQRHPEYLPREYKFRTASAELMDLLIAPLYGAKPEIGVRELVQNAVDACLERDDLLNKGLAEPIERPQDDVVVTLTVGKDGRAPTITIEDYGVGMSATIVDQYFLNIGASFRSSDLWRRNHEVEGHSSIHRTGRFGIGVLAAFLLGREIRVTTRHINATPNDGIAFSCTRGDESIEIRPCAFHHGTRIEIDLSPSVEKELIQTTASWDWYCLEEPKVRRRMILNVERGLNQRYKVPGCDADLESTKWRRVMAEGYDDVVWTYEALGSRYNKILICNGIFITNSSNRLLPKVSPLLNIIRADSPSLVVFDPDGRFPLNLQRDQIVGDSLTFDRPLALDVSDYFASRLVQAFEKLPAGISADSVALSVTPKVPGLGERYWSGLRLGYMILRQNGVVPADADLVREAAPTCILLDPVNLSANQGAFTSQLVRSWAQNYIPAEAVTHTKSSRTEFLRAFLGDRDHLGKEVGYLLGLPIVGRRLLLRKDDANVLFRPGSVPKSIWARLTLEMDLGTWGLWSIGQLPPFDLSLPPVCAQLDETGSFGFGMLYLDWAKENGKEDAASPSPFAEAWKKIVRSAVLPLRST